MTVAANRAEPEIHQMQAVKAELPHEHYHRYSSDSDHNSNLYDHAQNSHQYFTNRSAKDDLTADKYSYNSNYPAESYSNHQIIRRSTSLPKKKQIKVVVHSAPAGKTNSSTKGKREQRANINVRKVAFNE
ncbi:hypothetical protein SK128_019193 [Halocaridina rubra]|uniref:Uncharacterized protein n=1 Tax=Halocaridina rubra TaxID=373956 RepID=A0AAN9A7W9_HALRR